MNFAFQTRNGDTHVSPPLSEASPHPGRYQLLRTALPHSWTPATKKRCAPRCLIRRMPPALLSCHGPVILPALTGTTLAQRMDHYEGLSSPPALPCPRAVTIRTRRRLNANSSIQIVRPPEIVAFALICTCELVAMGIGRRQLLKFSNPLAKVADCSHVCEPKAGGL